MYNEDIKRRYIEIKERETILPTKYFETLFSNTEQYEKEYNKDICNFSLYEIKDFYKMYNTASISVLNTMNSHLGMYTQWCINEGFVIDGQNHFLELSSLDLKSYLNIAKINSSVITKDDIIKWCKLLDNARDKFILLSLFEFGRSQNYTDIIHARLCDIDGNNIRLYSGRTVVISDELKKFAIESSAAEEYNSSRMTKINILVDDGSIIKKFTNTDNDDEYLSGRRIYNTVIKSLKTVNANNININNIVNSGILSMVLRRSKELNLDPVEYLNSDYISEIENQYNVLRSSFKVNFIMTYADYL